MDDKSFRQQMNELARECGGKLVSFNGFVFVRGDEVVLIGDISAAPRVLQVLKMEKENESTKAI